MVVVHKISLINELVNYLTKFTIVKFKEFRNTKLLTINAEFRGLISAANKQHIIKAFSKNVRCLEYEKSGQYTQDSKKMETRTGRLTK